MCDSTLFTTAHCVPLPSHCNPALPFCESTESRMVLLLAVPMKMPERSLPCDLTRSKTAVTPELPAEGVTTMPICTLLRTIVSVT